MNNKLKNIELSESSILGWRVIDDTIILYTDFLLTSYHKNFVDFNPDIQYGCYKIGLIKFFSVESFSGLNEKTLLPKWDEKTKEYIDVLEIDLVIFEKNTIIIESDNSQISIRYNSFIVEIFDSINFDSKIISTIG